MPKQDVGKFRTNSKDQFYTKPAVAAACITSLIDRYPGASEYLWVEPSAGAGAFLQAIPEHIDCVGIDIEPAAPNILKADFLEWTYNSSKKCVVIGNPPFGRQSALAKAFIKRAATFAELIAFILPKSFVKPSMVRAFPMEFHCKHSVELEADSFTVNGESYDVPCVFQIWEKCLEPRELEAVAEPIGFQYVRGCEEYDIAFRRVGALAGRCYRAGGGTYSVQSHYFIRLEDSGQIEGVIKKVNEHEFPSNTVGPRSLSKGEANIVLNAMIRSV